MPEPLVLTNPLDDDSLLLVESSVLTRMEPFRQRLPTFPEAGGILTGFRRGPHIQVAHLTTPLARDQRSRIFFHRVDPGHQAFAEKQWNETSQQSDYVGEWHTHPERIPAPSGVDLREWEIILRRSSKPMVFIIAGTDAIWVGVGTSGRAVVRAFPVG